VDHALVVQHLDVVDAVAAADGDLDAALGAGGATSPMTAPSTENASAMRSPVRA
jgi:hypothetical protein